MVTACATPLGVVDLMKLYGRIHFTWNLRTDHLAWNGPIHKLFDSDIPLSSGSSFLSRLSPESFWQRFMAIDKREKKKDSLKEGHLKGKIVENYEAHYTVTLPNQLKCHIIEEGILIKTSKNFPERLEGTIRVVEKNTTTTQTIIQNLSGYDQLTGFPSQEVVYEALACLLTQTKGEGAPGGYLTFCIDKLSLIYFLHGLNAMRDTLLNVANTLNKFIRFNDVIGRTSGCTFGVAIKDADEWGVFKSADRLANACSKISIDTLTEKFSPLVSVGGASFRDDIEPLSIIKQAEQSLFDMQNIRGAETALNSTQKSQSNIKRPSIKKAGKRRIADDKMNRKQKGSHAQNKEKSA